MEFAEIPTTSPLPFESRGFGFIGMILMILLTSSAALLVTAMLVPAIFNRQVKETQVKGAALRAAVSAYQKNHGGSMGTYPGSLSALIINDNAPATCAMDNTVADPTYLTLQGWCGPYLDQVIVENADDYKTDGWGTLFLYNSGTGALSSCGPNRSCGDGDDLSF